ncbi:Imm50 family immunity protein [Pseudomonas alvandae]|uniref:Imm50 family immunity protein n=2 Tax=Pseudomonas TaxID=286 RepID=UPI0009B73964
MGIEIKPSSLKVSQHTMFSSEISTVWTAFVANNRNWKSIFGENYNPKKLSISYAILKDQSITIKLNSPIDSNNCPIKWMEKGYNEFEFELFLEQIHSVDISNLIFCGPIQITIEKKPSEYEIRLKISDMCTVNCKADRISISNISAYHNDYSE